MLTNTAIEIVVKKAGRQAKVRESIRCSPHTLRNYYAQKQLRLGLDVYSLSRLFGHESTAITNIYLQSINIKTHFLYDFFHTKSEFVICFLLYQTK
ncbi:tyrosine-type recombinase/integrase [Brevibacillus porteri]|uniref:tyrosine-type recombinase/integrase n=1 Tax=Brevibacillus porteri TaxID=2126350 RepID=UPI00370CA686